MRIVKAACFLVVFISIGCSPESYWYNEQKTYLRARSDCMECLYDSRGEIIDAALQANGEYSILTDVNDAEKQALFEQCMLDKGYNKVWDYKLGYSIRKGFVDYKDKTINIAGK